MIDRQAARGMITSLEAFKGHEREEYYFLVDPLTEFIWSSKFYNLSEMDKLARAILTSKPEAMAVEIDPPVTAQLLAEQIKSWVEDIRQKLFHSKSAPFSCISDAQKWLDAVNRKIDEWNKRIDERNKRVDGWNKRSDEYHDCWQAILERYPHIKGGIEEWSLMKKQGIEVEFPTADEWQKLAEIQLAMESLEIGKVGEPPERDEEMKIYDALLDGIWEICKVTGFTVESVEMCILADASPVLPPFTFNIIRETHSLPSGVNLQNRFARVTIRGDLTFQDLRSLHRSIRGALGIKRLKRLTKKHSQLYEIVTKRGSIPKGRGGTVKFWESIKDEWNTEYPSDAYTTWKGIKIAYERIVAQLERRIMATEAQNER